MSVYVNISIVWVRLQGSSGVFQTCVKESFLRKNQHRTQNRENSVVELYQKENDKLTLLG